MAETQAVTPDRNPYFFKLDTAQTGSEHPERRPNEIFLGYGGAWTFDVHYDQYPSRRKGTRVIDDFNCDRTQDALNVGGLYPIFTDRKEYEEFQESLRTH